ncbi:MAG: hypothetical protein PVI57_18780 [Gemmatimonadota bacterium]|jgi:hypothetical protein
MNELVESDRGRKPTGKERDGSPTHRHGPSGLPRDLRRAGLLSGMGAVGFLDLLALEDITTSVQPDYVAETVLLLASIPALIVLFTLWRRTGAGGEDDDERKAGEDGA